MKRSIHAGVQESQDEAGRSGLEAVEWLLGTRVGCANLSRRIAAGVKSDSPGLRCLLHLTVSAKETVFVTPPPVAVSVIVYLPAAAFGSAPAPRRSQEAASIPAARRVADSDTFELNPPVTETLTLAVALAP